MRAEDDTIATASTAVLADHALFNHVTRFQSGYPRAVVAMIQAAAKDKLEIISHVEQKREGALPRLAVAAADIQMLHFLFDLKTRATYKNDPMLQFVDVMRTAVLRRNTEVLDCLKELKNRDSTWLDWEPNLMSSALYFNASNVRMFEWLYAHLPREMCGLQEGFTGLAMRIASVEVIRWLFERGYEITSRDADGGAFAGNLAALMWVYENTDVRCNPSTVWESVERGNWGVLMLVLTEEQTVETYERAINAAAWRGRLEMVKYFVERGFGVNSPDVIDEAARGGYLKVVQYLHDHLPRRTASEPSSASAAESEGRLGEDMLLSRSEDSAVSTGCTSNALMFAAMGRHLSVVEFLCKHRTEGDIGAVIVSAASKGYLAVVEILLKHHRSQDAVFPAVKAAAQARQMEVVKFLCENQEQHGEVSLRFLAQAMTDGANWLVRAVVPFATVTELVRARDIVVEQQRKRDRQNLWILERFIYLKKLTGASEAERG